MKEPLQQLVDVLEGAEYESQTVYRPREFMDHHIEAIARHLLAPENIDAAFDALLAARLAPSPPPPPADSDPGRDIRTGRPS